MTSTTATIAFNTSAVTATTTKLSFNVLVGHLNPEGSSLNPEHLHKVKIDNVSEYLDRKRTRLAEQKERHQSKDRERQRQRKKQKQGIDNNN